MTTDITIPYEYPEVVADFLQDIGLAVDVGDDIGTPEQRLSAVLSALGSLFSLDVPTIGDDPMQALRQIARDTKLANIARERAFFRLYLITRKKKPGPVKGVQVPMWYGLEDDEGVQMETQEQFIGWFTSKSGLGRASTFRRIRVYQRLEQFGVEGQDAWLKVLKMPTVMQELAELVAKWDKNEFVGVDKDLAIGIAEGILPAQVPVLETAFEKGDTDAILDAYKPVAREVFSEASSYEKAKDAIDHIKHDILGKPTVRYRWVVDEEAIGVTVTIPVISEGTIVTERVIETVLFVDNPEPPDVLMQDLFKRLPISNRHDLPGY